MLWQRLGECLFIAALAGGAVVAIARAIHDGCTDFTGFRDAGRYVLEHHARDRQSVLARYWPSADVPWMVAACLPLPLGAAIWYAVGCWSWLGLLRTIRGYLLGEQPLGRQLHCRPGRQYNCRPNN